MFHHYCFVRENSIITDHKPLVAILKRGSNTNTQITINSTQNIPIVSQNHIQAWIIFVHSRPVVQTKPQRKTKTQKYLACS